MAQLLVSRNGFSLVELLLALTLGLALVALGARFTGIVLRSARLEAERAGMDASLAEGVGFLAHELESLGRDSIAGADLDSTPAGIGWRAHRGFRITCRIAADTLVVHADTALDWSARQPVPGRDSLLLYAAGTSAAPIDAWDVLPLAGVRAEVCPSGASGLALATSLDASRIAARQLGPPTVVRIFESLAARAYAGAAGWQLGVEGRSAAAAVQPLVGSLLPNGFTAAAYDTGGTPVPLGPAAAFVELGLAGRTERQLAAGLGGPAGQARDSVRVGVLLRNVR